MRHLIIVLLLILTSIEGMAQVDADTVSNEDRRQVIITTMNWDVVQGYIIHQEAQAFVVRTYGGIEMTIPFAEVREMAEIDGPRQAIKRTPDLPGDKEWFPNEHGYAYLVSGNYLPMPKQTGHIKNTYLTTNTFRYSFTDRFSLGGGFEAISSILLNPAFLISPKVNVQLGENWYGGLTVAYAGVLTTWFDQGSGIGLVQLGSTLGSMDRNFTVGTGWTLLGGELSSAPFVSLSGMVRFSRRLVFISDNLIAPLYDAQYRPLVSYGLRYLGRNVSGEVIFVNTPDLFPFFGLGLPLLSLSVALD